MGLFTSEPEAIEAGIRNLRIEIFDQLFYAIFLIFHAIMLGAGHTVVVFFSSFVNCILARLIFAAVFNHFFGVTGVYVACMIAPATSIPVGVIYYRRGAWRRSLVGTDGVTE